MRYIDLFAGIGGFRYALDSIGLDCVFTSEIDKIPTKMYKILYNEESIHGDITEIDAVTIPDHDLLVGGFPCQGFSKNGKREGFEYKTGHLFMEALRVAEEKKPKFVLLENVVGLLSHDKRKTIAIMLKSLTDAGYSVDFQIMISTDFGIPQKRERVFIVGVLNHTYEDWTETKFPQVNRTKVEVKDYYSDIKSFNFPFPIGTNKDVTFESIAEKDLENVEYLEIGDFIKDLGDNNFRVKDGTIQGYADFKAIPYYTTLDYAFPTSKTRRGRVKQGITKTLDQPAMIAVFDGKGFRRITALEAFRLQGFPDESYHKLKDKFVESHLYKRPARSVTIPIVKALGEVIQEYMTNVIDNEE